jgi:hypothetical protein
MDHGTRSFWRRKYDIPEVKGAGINTARIHLDHPKLLRFHRPADLYQPKLEI